MKLSSRKHARAKQIELQMTSMIDVVFLLLIFFLISASFVRTERHLDSAVDVKRKAASSRQRDIEPTVIEIARDAGGVFVYKLGGREIRSYDELADVVRQKRQLDLRNLLGPGAVGSAGGQHPAFVRVGDEAPFRMAAAAIQACKSAGYLGVAYVPQKP